MFDPQHCGLYFGEMHLRQARDLSEVEPFRSAWALLHQRRQLDLLALAQWQGLIYRFEGDLDAGARAVQILQQDDLMPSAPASLTEALAAATTMAQCFEMLRDHPSFEHSGAWMQAFAALVGDLNQVEGDRLHVEQVWLNALNLAAGIVLEDESAFAQAADRFREIIRRDVHPDGYIRRAAQGPRGESLRRMLLTAQALILTAEAATNAGEDLWAFNERGVSALTPTPYLLYYAYYPEKWRWDGDIEGNEVPEEGQSDLTLEGAQALYRRHSGLWEMAQYRHWSKDREMLLHDLRPVYDLWGGGLVSLTHGTVEPRRKRFGLF